MSTGVRLSTSVSTHMLHQLCAQAGTHTFSCYAPGMQAGAHTAWNMHTNLFLEKQTICMSHSSEVQIMHTYTHTQCSEGSVENRQQKGPKGPEAQPEGLLAFLLQGEKEQEEKGGKKRLVESIL